MRFWRDLRVAMGWWPPASATSPLASWSLRDRPDRSSGGHRATGSLEARGAPGGPGLRTRAHSPMCGARSSWASTGSCSRRASRRAGAVVEAVCAGQVSAPSEQRQALRARALTAREKQVLMMVVAGLTNSSDRRRTVSRREHREEPSVFGLRQARGLLSKRSGRRHPRPRTRTRTRHRRGPARPAAPSATRPRTSFDRPRFGWLGFRSDRGAYCKKGTGAGRFYGDGTAETQCTP